MTAAWMAAGVTAAACAAYGFLRPRFSAAVECWFCQHKYRVSFDQRQCFVCQNCGQYNGFSSDGDYDRRDPLMDAVDARERTGEAPRNGLCRVCNLNQDLKTRQLADFVPKREEDFDEEVEDYRRHLERAYRLCRTCK